VPTPAGDKDIIEVGSTVAEGPQVQVMTESAPAGEALGGGGNHGLVTRLVTAVEKLAEPSSPPEKWDGRLLEVRLVVAGRTDSRSRTLNMSKKEREGPVFLNHVRQKLHDQLEVIGDLEKEFLFSSSAGLRISYECEDTTEVTEVATKEEKSGRWFVNMEKDRTSLLNLWRGTDFGAKFLEDWEGHLKRNQVLHAFVPGSGVERAEQAFATWKPYAIPIMLPYTDSSTRVTVTHDAHTVSSTEEASFSLEGGAGGGGRVGVSHSGSVSQSTLSETIQLTAVTEYPRVRIKLEPEGRHGKCTDLLRPSVPFVEAMLEIFDALSGKEVDKTKLDESKSDPQKDFVKEACAFMAKEASRINKDIRAPARLYPKTLPDDDAFLAATEAFERVQKRSGLMYNSEFHLGGKIFSEATVSKSQWIRDQSIQSEFKAGVSAMVGNFDVSASNKSARKEEKNKGLNIRFSGTVGGDALQSHDLMKWKESLKEPHNWSVTVQQKHKFVWKILSTGKPAPTHTTDKVGDLCELLLELGSAFAIQETKKAIDSDSPTAIESSTISLDKLITIYNKHQKRRENTYGLKLLATETVVWLENHWKCFRHDVTGRWWHKVGRLLRRVVGDDKKKCARLIEKKKLSKYFKAVAKQWHVLTKDEKELMESLWSRYMEKHRIRLLEKRGRKAKMDEKTVSEPATKEVGALAEQSLMAIQRETPEQQIRSTLNIMKANLENASIQENGCIQLGLLADDERKRRSIVASGGIAVILGAMTRHPAVRGVQEYGCRALGNVAVSNDAIRDSIAAEGGIAVIIDAMKEHAAVAGVQENGCDALGNLAWNNDTNCVSIGKAGGIAVILDAIRQHPSVSDVQASGCNALANLAASVDANCVRIAEAGGIAEILSAMRRHTAVADVQARGCEAIANLAVNNDANRGRIIEMEGIAVVQEAMKQHANSPDVQEYGSKALANLQAAGGSAPTEADNGAVALGENGRETAANGPEDVVVVTTTHTAADVPLVASSSTQPRGAASENAVTPDSAKSVDQEQKKSTSLSSILSYFKRKGAPPGPPPPGGTTPGQ